MGRLITYFIVTTFKMLVSVFREIPIYRERGLLKLTRRMEINIRIITFSHLNHEIIVR